MRADTMLWIAGATVLVAAILFLNLRKKAKKEGLWSYWEYQRQLDGRRYTQELMLRNAVPIPLGPYVYEPITVSAVPAVPAAVPTAVPAAMPAVQQVQMPGYTCRCERVAAA